MNSIQENLFSSSQVDKQEPSYISLIEEIGKLVKQDKEKGRMAWKLGEKLSKLKNEMLAEEAKSDQEFEYFVAEQFGYSKYQLQRRISIREWIDNFELITKKMAIGHLEQVISLEDKNAIEELLKVLAKIENKNQENTLPYNEKLIASLVREYKTYKKEQSSNKEYENISVADDISENNSSYNFTNISLAFEDYLNIEISNSIIQNEKIGDIRANVWGKIIESDKFREISKIYETKPIDEQGLVGLFCACFPIIKSMVRLDINNSAPLGFNGFSKNQELTLEFSKIIGIRQRFPDAIIEFYIFPRNKDVDKRRVNLNIEFEFKSFNYTSHGHYKEKEECHLIICWKHDKDDQKRWKSWKKYHYKKAKPLPLILAMQKLLEEEEVNLINLN